jgi:DNA-binding CsgD family transcriptional regulator
MLLGRAQEQEVLGGLIDAVKSGLSGALILYGEAGMGKTALLDYTVSSAPELRLLRIAGVEAESAFGFAALHRLLAPLLGELENLPQPQHDALGAAFGLVTEAPADLFLVALASLTLLASSASPRGLLCVIDDAQWVDPESLNVLAFVGRRLNAEGIALIFGYRTSDTVFQILAGIASLPVAGLPEPAAIQLLSSTTQSPINPATARRIVAETSGCPLALTELTTHLTTGQFAGVEPLSDPLPIGRQLETHFLRQIEAMPAATQLFLLVAAAETSGEPSLVRKVARGLGCARDAEEDAIRQRLIVTKARVEFRHPLIRSAVYAGATLAERRAVHQAMADSTDRSVEPERWARHVAAAATGPDDRLASEIEVVALRARERGGHAAEASLWVQAADLTEERDKRSARLLEASAAALNSGMALRAQKLLHQAQPGLTDPMLVAEARHLEGRMCFALSRSSYAPGLQLQAAQQFLPLNVDRAREAMLEGLQAFVTAQYFTHDREAIDIARVALASRDGPTPDQLSDLLLDGTSLLVTGRYPEAIELLRRAGRLLLGASISPHEIAKWQFCGAFAANELMDDRLYVRWAERVEGASREQGALFALLLALFALAEHYVRAGQFSSADTSLAEAMQVGEAIGWDADHYQSLRALLLAWRAEAPEARSAAKTLIELGVASGSAMSVFVGYHALAILELGSGNYGAALVASEQISNAAVLGFGPQIIPIVVEAGIRSGNRDAADSALARFQVRATAAGTPWALGLLTRSQALLADDAEAEELYEVSISYLERTLVSTDLALAHLSYGEWLRRQQRRVDARTHLRTAHDMFASMGAAGFAERARAELLATGERVSRRTVEHQSDLTAQELQIATMASRGATNPEIATKLFLSASTVDYHLRKVFRKLGITSRRQLESSLAS